METNLGVEIISSSPKPMDLKRQLAYVADGSMLGFAIFDDPYVAANIQVIAYDPSEQSNHFYSVIINNRSAENGSQSKDEVQSDVKLIFRKPQETLQLCDSDQSTYFVPISAKVAHKLLKILSKTLIS